MNKPYILIWKNYDGVKVERFHNEPELEARATEVLNKSYDYGHYIVWAGLAKCEYKFEAYEKVTAYRAVESEGE